MFETVMQRLTGSRRDDARRIALAFIASVALLLALVGAAWQATRDGNGAGVTIGAAADGNAVTAAGYFGGIGGHRLPILPPGA